MQCDTHGVYNEFIDLLRDEHKIIVHENEEITHPPFEVLTVSDNLGSFNAKKAIHITERVLLRTRSVIWSLCNVSKCHQSFVEEYGNFYKVDRASRCNTLLSTAEALKQAQEVCFSQKYFRKTVCGFISWWLRKYQQQLYSTILIHPFNEWCIDGTHYSGLYYKLYDELCNKYGLKITEVFAINECGFICNDVDILGGKKNVIMAELFAVPLLLNLTLCPLKINLFYHIGTDAAEKQFNILKMVKEIAITRNKGHTITNQHGIQYDLYL